MTIFYLDCEFDGHNGNTMSLALVREDGYSLYIIVDMWAANPWVQKHVVPVMYEHDADVFDILPINQLGDAVRQFIGPVSSFCVISDSPTDIYRLCQALSTDSEGNWHSTDYECIKFEVRNVDAYPTRLGGAVQHNAWWDACALRAVFCDDAFYEGRARRDNKSSCGDLDYEI